MFKKFPPLFNYSIEDNIEPKLNSFVVEMGRDLNALFSLDNKIKPRHQSCIEHGVYFPLHALLKTSEEKFLSRL